MSMGFVGSSANAQRILTVPMATEFLLALIEEEVILVQGLIRSRQKCVPIDCVTFEFPSRNWPWLFCIKSCLFLANASETTFSAAPVSGNAEVREPFTRPERPLLILVTDFR